jgi:magnesium-transporting ATPase (P-type)
LSAADALDRLGVPPGSGLDRVEVERRRARHGPNTLTERRGQSPLVRFLLQFHQHLVYILLIAAGVTAALKEIVDALVIFGVVLINAVVGFLQEAKALRAIAALARGLTSYATVLREAYSSALVTYGAGTGVVVATGDASEIGRISELIASVDSLDTPLTRKIRKFSHVLLVAIVSLAALAFVVGRLRGTPALEVFLAAVAPAVGAIPFDSQHQYMETLHGGDAGGPRVAYVKGSMESLLPRCQSMLLPEGERPLDPDRVRSEVAEMAQRDLRVLAFARREFPPIASAITHEDLPAGLVFLGVQAMIDPPRPEAAAAVAACRRAGIRVKMITGDHPVTAAAIARQIGIGDPAATGRADIGVAMALAGTEAGREASDMILTDDNFASIQAAVEEGRGVIDNLRKFIVWTLPTNGGEGLVILLALRRGLRHLRVGAAERSPRGRGPDGGGRGHRLRPALLPLQLPVPVPLVHRGRHLLQHLGLGRRGVDGGLPAALHLRPGVQPHLPLAADRRPGLGLRAGGRLGGVARRRDREGHPPPDRIAAGIGAGGLTGLRRPRVHIHLQERYEAPNYMEYNYFVEKRSNDGLITESYRF